MSQAGIIDFIGTHPEIPTLFVCNVGTAIPIANTLEILGSAVAAVGIPLETVGSGNTVSIQVQRTSAAASSIAANAGIASFSSADFSVDANGFVTLAGSGAVENFTVDAATVPGTNPVVPNGSGNITVTGGQVAAGTTANIIRTNSLAANTYTIQIQRSQAVGSSTIGDNGVSHFNSTYFTVDANGFVSVSGTGLGQTITGNTGGALSPTAGNWNIFGTSTAAGTTPVQTSGTGSTLTVQVQKAQAIASTNATNVGLAAFDSARFTVDGNGFVSTNGSGIGETITGNSGGALSPTAGNWNILGSGSITTSGSGSTLTVQLTGLTNHAVQVGGAGTTLTQVGPSATVGSVLASNGSTSDPSFQTLSSLGAILTITGNSGGAESPLAGNFNLLGTGSITVVGSANTETIELTGLTNHNVLVGAGTATITNVAPSATSGVPLISQGSSSDPAFGTAVVAGGGTGDTSFTAYAVICGGTTSTGALQSIASVGTSGQVLTSNGAGALPTFQAVSASGAITTITGNSGGAEVPTAGGNFNILGTGSITVVGSANTETVELTGLTNHAVLVGAGTATITKVGPSATVGAAFIGAGSTTDPAFSTTFKVLDATFQAIESASVVGAGVQLSVQNTDNTNSSSSARITVTVGGSSAGDAYALFDADVAGHNYETGIQQSSGNYLITSGANTATSNISGTTIFQLTSAGVPSFPASPLGIASGGTAATSFNTNGAVISGTTSTSALSAVSLSNQKFLVGNTSAAPTAKGFSVVRQVFTSSGTYTPTAGMLYCDIECYGGGGGGGGVSGSAGSYASAGGGGAGSYSKKISSSATVGASQTVTIGAAGTAATAGANNGGNGGDTSVGTICIGKGGTGGGGGLNGTPGAGGAGGVAGTGDVTGSGQTGFTGVATVTVVTTTGVGGQGGSTAVGGGGLAAANGGGTGGSATGFGAGGGGANVTNTTAAGGAGTAGLVIVTEYVLS